MSDHKITWEKFKMAMGGFMFQAGVGFVVGVIIAGYGVHWYNSYRVGEAIKLGCFLHNTKVYQITERP
jgi:hypothetical protein